MMTDCKWGILKILADGAAHSERELSERLSVASTIIHRTIPLLRELGLAIQLLPNGAYSLPKPLELLDRQTIVSRLSASARAELSQLEVCPVIDSTNNYLLTKANQGWPGGTVCLAELQQAGRGRQGRRWLSPFGANVAFSLLWRFNTSPAALGGLSLATGVAIARVLRRLGASEVGLKWPNDVLYQGRKLGGILLESGGTADSCYVVAGIGLNVALPDEAAQTISQPWIDLAEILGAERVSRNQLAALLIEEVIAVYRPFASNGFIDFLEEWATLDAVAGKSVALQLSPNTVVKGIARGVDASGALLLETMDGRIGPYLGGEISLRVET